MSKILDQHKIEIMALAIKNGGTSKYEEIYKKMVDLIADYKPEPKEG